MISVGIDIAKRHHKPCMVDETDKPVLQIFIENTQQNFAKVMQALQHLEAAPNET